MDGFAFQIDVIALRWGIGILIFFLIAWIILARKLLKPEPKAIKVNLADRYNDLKDKEINVFGIKSDLFKKMACNNFINIHNAFMEYDYDMLRKYLTKDLYDYYYEQLEGLKKRKYKNIIKDYEVLNTKIYQVINEHDMLIVNVYLNIRMFDYMIDINTGECINGDENNQIDYEFELSFVKEEDGRFLLRKKACVNDMKKDK